MAVTLSTELLSVFPECIPLPASSNRQPITAERSRAAHQLQQTQPATFCPLPPSPPPWHLGHTQVFGRVWAGGASCLQGQADMNPNEINFFICCKNNSTSEPINVLIRTLQSMMSAMMPLSAATPVTMVPTAATTRPAVPRLRATLRLRLTPTAMAPLAVSVRTVRGGQVHVVAKTASSWSMAIRTRASSATRHWPRLSGCGRRQVKPAVSPLSV